jgi:hypothetical protein
VLELGETSKPAEARAPELLRLAIKQARIWTALSAGVERPPRGEYEGPIKHAPDTWIHRIAILRPAVVEALELVPNQQHW